MDFISWDRVFGLIQSGRRVFGKFFTIGGMVKSRMDPNQRKAQNQKGFLFRRKINPRKDFLEEKFR